MMDLDIVITAKCGSCATNKDILEKRYFLHKDEYGCIWCPLCGLTYSSRCDRHLFWLDDNGKQYGRII